MIKYIGKRASALQSKAITPKKFTKYFKFIKVFGKFECLLLNKIIFTTAFRLLLNLVSIE